MRAGLVLVVAGCASAGRPVVPETETEPDDRLVQRLRDRVVTMDTASTGVIEWTDGPCAGATFRGTIARNLPAGQGKWYARGGDFFTIEGNFSGLKLDGVGRAVLTIALPLVKQVSARFEMHPSSCAIRPVPGSMEVAGVHLEAAKEASTFRGTLLFASGAAVLWRGAFDVRGTQSGYFLPTAAGFRPIATVACIAGTCDEQRDGMELFVADDGWHLYQGGFHDGFRHGRATVAVARGDGIDTFHVVYERGKLADNISLQRAGYVIRSKAPELTVIESLRPSHDWLTPWLDAPGASSPVEWSRGIVKLPSATFDLARMIERDLAPEPDSPCLQCTESPSIWIKRDWIYSLSTRFDPPRVEELWLRRTRTLVRGIDLRLSGNDRLDGTGVVVRNGREHRVRFDEGERLDLLGFESFAAYKRASPAERKARARKVALAASVARARDEASRRAIRRILDGAGTSLSEIASARDAAIAAAALTEPESIERALRQTHVAIERAYNAVIAGRAGGDEALKVLSPSDPILEIVGGLTHELTAQEERLRALFDAYEAFQYTDDAERLIGITAAFRTVLDRVPTAPTADGLKALRKALAP